MAQLAGNPPGGLLQKANTLEMFEDWMKPVDLGSGLTAGTDGFADVVGDVGSSVSIHIDGRNGDRRQNTTSDNEEVYSFTDDLFVPYSGGEAGVIGCVDTTATASGKTNIIFGLIGGSIGANMLLDDGAGPVVGVNQALIWQVEGEDYWRCGASLAANSNPAHLSTTKAGRLHDDTFSYQSLMIKLTGAGRDLAVSYHVDINGLGGFQPLVDKYNRAIVDHVFLTSGNMGQMSLVCGCKQGTATALDVWWDWAGGWSSRRRPPVGD